MSPFILLLLLLPPTPSLSQNTTCPLDFSVLSKFVGPSSSSTDTPSLCAFSLRALHLVLSTYLLSSSLFLPTSPTSPSCWRSLLSSLSPLLSSINNSSFSLPSSCGFQSDWISRGCMNLSSLSSFDAAVPSSSRSDVASHCNTSLKLVPSCTSCTTSLSALRTSYLTGSDYGGNVTTCNDYPFIYAAALATPSGPSDPNTAYCLFSLTAVSNSSSSSSGGGGSRIHPWAYGLIAAGSFLLLLLAVSASWIFLAPRRRRRRHLERRKEAAEAARKQHSQALESLGASTTLVKFTFDEIKAATGNFSRDHIIGRGGYGNVYRGTLPDDSEVAVKRFKNCSVAGDASFAHEVEVIASVRHVNLVALRGYCLATTQVEGHQRIIVCDLMHNGSLHDHLFGSETCRLSWPARQRIAVGTARGLAYLHYGAQPAIIHRDIKASNILLDDGFEAKVADFGLAKFAPEGMTHVSTRVAGTLGYVAPEYALYGQLTEKSDVYSFGVVMLELLSGRKAFIPLGDGQSFVITDWAWSLVRRGQTLDVIQEGMEGLGPSEEMEKYVLIAVLCTHPQLHARPSMDQIVKILETDSAVPLIPDRPIPIVANMADIERSASSSHSGRLFSPTGFQAFSYTNDRVRSGSSEEGSSSELRAG